MIKYAQTLFQQQFIIKVGIYNRASEAFGFHRTHFFDACRAPASYNLTIKLRFVDFTHMLVWKN